MGGGKAAGALAGRRVGGWVQGQACGLGDACGHVGHALRSTGADAVFDHAVDTDGNVTLCGQLAAAGSLDLSAWTFTDWTSGTDTITIFAANGENVITTVDFNGHRFFYEPYEEVYQHWENRLKGLIRDLIIVECLGLNKFKQPCILHILT